MSKTKEMSVFDSTFEKQRQDLNSVEQTYEEAMRDAGGSSILQEASRKERDKGVSSIANAVLARDRALKLSFPFKLDANNCKKILNNVGYYRRDRVLEGGRSCLCIICGKKMSVGDVYFSDEGSAVSSCLTCSNPGIEIDGERFKLKVCE